MYANFFSTFTLMFSISNVELKLANVKFKVIPNGERQTNSFVHARHHDVKILTPLPPV